MNGPQITDAMIFEAAQEIAEKLNGDAATIAEHYRHYCAAACLDSATGYTTGCVHYPIKRNTDVSSARGGADLMSSHLNLNHSTENVMKNAITTVAQLPRCFIQSVGSDDKTAASAKVRKLVAEGWAVKNQMEALKDRMSEINSKLIEAVGPGHALILEGQCRSTVSNRRTQTISDADALHKALGDERFSLLVSEKVSYKPEPKLIEMACDGDHPLAEAIRSAIRIDEAPSVTWRAEKPLPEAA